MTLREALEINTADRITINGLSYEVEKVNFSKEELNTQVNIHINSDIETGKIYRIADCSINNNYIAFLIK